MPTRSFTSIALRILPAPPESPGATRNRDDTFVDWLLRLRFGTTGAVKGRFVRHLFVFAETAVDQSLQGR
jgi:hypothetical protein